MSLWSKARRASAGRYFVAVAVTVIMFAARVALDPVLGERSPFILFLPAVLAAGLFGGVGPGLLALLLSLAFGTYAFLPPRGAFGPLTTDVAANVAVFAAASGALLWMVRRKVVAEQRVVQVQMSSGQALSQSLGLLEAVMESVPDPVYVKDPEGRLTMVNTATARVFGRPREVVLGRRDRDLLPAAVAEAIEAVDREVLAGETRVVEEHVLDAEKGWRDYLSTKSALRDGTGAVTGLIGLSRDVTERKAAERELVRLNRELEARVEQRTGELQRANAELQAFTYSVAHDLRAPLRAMKGFSVALREDYAERLDDTGLEYLARIDDGASRLDLLIQDLLAYSRLSQAELALQSTDLNSVVQQSLDQVIETIRAAGARVTVDPALPRVSAHERVLVQVVSNLVANAVTFVKPGVTPEVFVTALKTDDRVRLEVVDNGIGVAPEHQSRIFEVFQRLHGMAQYPGTGIGLAIVRKGVERMGGSAGVSSQLGTGSRFWIELEAA